MATQKDLKDIIKFHKAVNDFKKAALKVSKAWDGYNPNLELDTYPFSQNFDDMISDLINWENDLKDIVEETKNKLKV